MKDNVFLQIEMLENKIERLMLQKEFYQKILDRRKES
jgi:hypothetical protein